MTIAVNGPGGITINFPDGTDAGTIHDAMTQAAGGVPTQLPPLPDGFQLVNRADKGDFAGPWTQYGRRPVTDPALLAQLNGNAPGMPNFDPDAYLASGPSAAPFDPDAYLRSAPANNPLTAFRAQYPQYNDMPDSQLGDALYGKFYSDMPRARFNAMAGLQPAQSAPPLPAGYVLENGQQSQTNQPLPDQFSPTDVAKSGGVGLGEGAIGLAGMPGNVRSIASDLTDKIGNMFGASPDTIANIKNSASMAAQMIPGMGPFATGPKSSEIQSAVEAGTGPFYQPQTRAGKYAETIGEFAPAAIGGPESLATRLLTRAVAPGVASEGAGELTQGTAAEPYARAAAALVGAGGAASVANRLTRAESAIPTVEALGDAASAAYNSPEVAAVQIKPAAMQSVANDIDQQLLQAKVDKTIAPTVTQILDGLQAPRFGMTGTISDFDLARQSLSDVPPNEMRAAGVVRKGIDNYLGNIPQGDLLGGDAAAANAKLLEARANYAAMKRSQDVTNAMGRAEDQAGATYSGGNIENATRQQLKPLLDQKRGVSKTQAFQDYTPQEVAALRTAVIGTYTGNAVRNAGKFLGGGGGVGNMGAAIAAGAGAHEAGYDPAQAIGIGLLSALGGRALNHLGGRLAVNRATAVDELLRSRSPLASTIPPNPSQIHPLAQALMTGQLTLPQILGGTYGKAAQ